MKPKQYKVTATDGSKFTFEFYDQVYELVTICIIRGFISGLTRGGTSTLNPNDLGKYDYDLHTGRKYALQDALASSTFSRKDKTRFFDVFFKYHERRSAWNRKRPPQPA